jgi:hypothetical protein
MKLLAIALIGTITCTAASAQTYTPFDSDGCVPGMNSQGQFIDQAGTVLESAGWVVTNEQTVLTADGRPVYLDESCVGKLAKSTAKGGGLSTGVAIGLGALVVALATSSTNGTN